MYRPVAFLFLITACQVDPEPWITNQPREAGDVEVTDHREGEASCHSATAVDPNQWTKTCEEELCVPERWSIKFSTPTSESLPCFTALAEVCGQQKNQGGFFYRGASPLGERTSLEVGFDSRLGDNFSDEALARHFGFIFAEVVIDRARDARIQHTVKRRFNRDDLQDLRFESGRMKASADFQATEIEYDLFQIDPDCLIDDIVLNCRCRFEGIDLPARIELDLELSSTL